MIDKLKANAPVLVVAVAILAFAGLLMYNGTKQTSTKSEITVSTPDERKTSEKTPKSYTFTAQAGDSYTVLVRQAIQNYAKSENITIQNAQIIAAETVLVQAAGSPELEIGQKLTIKTTSVHDAVKKAQALTSDQLAAWETYVPYVQF